MRVCLGGTFDPMHAGHEALLRAAAKGATNLFVGVTDGSLALRPERAVASLEERSRRIEAFVRSTGYAGVLTIRALSEPYGPAVVGDYDRVVVSPETQKGAEAINARRREADRPLLEVIVVPHLLGQDRLPLSGTAIADGRLDRDGRRLRSVQVAVGSANPVKVAAVKAEFAVFLPSPADVTALPLPSGVPEQPRGLETLRGAENRAKAARTAMPGCDYAVGIEAGLIQMPGSEAWVEAQACVVIDRTGWTTTGWGPAFAYPDFVTRRALDGEMVSTILGPVARDPRIGSTTGAIGFLTDGRMDRTSLTRIAILMALTPRIRRALYTGPQG